MYKIICISVFLLLISVMLPAQNFGSKTALSTEKPALTGTVKCDTLNVRHSEWGKIIGSVYRGNTVVILDQSRDGNWYKIQYRSDSGFVYKKYVKLSGADLTANTVTSTQSSTQAESTARTGYSTANQLNVRREPWGAIVDSLRLHEKVSVIGQKGEWYKIRHSSGSAYVHSKWVTFSLESEPSGSTSSNTGASLGEGTVVGKANGSGYYPYNNAMEGGYNDMRGNKLCTLQDYLAGKVPYVSIALDQYLYKGTIKYGDKFRIPELEKKYGRKIEFRAVDCGGAFKWKGFTKVDICTASAKDSYESTLNGTLTLVKL